MKAIYLSFVIIFYCNISVQIFCQNSWIPLQQPQIGYASKYLNFHSNDYLLTSSGIYKRNQDSSNWRHVYTDFSNIFDNLYIHTDDTIYLCLVGSGILFTSNGGMSWMGRNVGLTNLTVNNIFFKAGKLFASTYGGLFISSNYGLDWNLHSFPNQYVERMFIDSRGYWYVSIYNTIRASYDSGFTWVTLTGESHSIYENSLGKLVRIGEKNIYLSADGIQWNNIFILQPEYQRFASTVMLNDSMILVSTYQKARLFFIHTSGTVIDSTYFLHPVTNSLVYLYIVGVSNATGKVIAYSKYGILSSMTNGYSWVYDQSGILSESYVSYILETAFYYFVQSGSLTFRSDKKFSNFELVADSFSSSRIKNFLSFENNLYMLLDTAVYRSTDQGDSWHLFYYQHYYHDNYFSLWAGNNKIVIGGDNRLFYTLDGGQTWSSKNFPNTATPIVYSIIQLPNTNFAIATDDGFWLCDSVFSNLRRIISTSPIKNLFLSKNQILLGYGISSDIHYSLDYGNNWLQITSINQAVTSIAENDSGQIYLGTHSGVFYSNFPFTNWGEFSEGLKDKNITTILSDSIGHLLVGTGKAGLFRTLHSTTSAKDYTDKQPEKFLLYQNYPNPFNPTTVISYQLSASGNVTLKIYDILGNEVAKLINTEFKEAGYHNYQLLINNYQLPSGIYFYQLRAGSFTQTKKMILLR